MCSKWASIAQVMLSHKTARFLIVARGGVCVETILVLRVRVVLLIAIFELHVFH